MSKVIEFPSKEKRMERLLREQLSADLPGEAIEELASELQEVAERIASRRSSFTLYFPQAHSPGEVEYITRQVEEIIAELMNAIKSEEGEIFNLIIRYHLLLHEARQMVDT